MSAIILKKTDQLDIRTPDGDNISIFVDSDNKLMMKLSNGSVSSVSDNVAGVTKFTTSPDDYKFNLLYLGVLSSTSNLTVRIKMEGIGISNPDQNDRFDFNLESNLEVVNGVPALSSISANGNGIDSEIIFDNGSLKFQNDFSSYDYPIRWATTIKIMKIEF